MIVLRRAIFLSLFLTLFHIQVFPQQHQHYPVHATVQVLRPHGLHLSDYYSGTRDRLVVTLLNRDFGQPTLNVRLRVTVRNGNHFMMRSRDELPAPVITLMHGVPLRLTGADLAPYLMPNRVILQGHLQNGKLPTGNTEFIVQVLDHATGRVLSQAASTFAFLELHQPPFLNLPEQGTGVTFRIPQHIRFQWFPRHQGVTQTVYEFTLRELPNNDIPPQQAFLFGNTIYQTTTRFTTLNLTHLQPLLEPGRRYAWQVRAMAMDGIDEIGMFANNGFSEIGWFRLLENCPPPINVRGEAAGNRGMTIRWQPHHEHQSFIVQYRVRSYQEEEVFPWNSVEVWGNETTISGLRPAWTYLYRVGALCGSMREPVFSDIGEVTLPLDDPERLARCGNDTPDPITNWEPLAYLRVGDVVAVGRGGFPLTITEVTPLGDGWFTGRGRAPIGWVFEHIQFAHQFERLRVNTDFRQIGGRVVSEYDPNASRIADLNVLDYGGRRTTAGGVVFPTIKLGFTVPPMPEMTYNPDTGELTVLDLHGTPRTIIVPRNEQGEPTFPVTIECESGQRFKVDLPESSEADIAAGRPVTPIVTPIRDLAPGSFNTAALDENAGVVVRFERGAGRFGFDAGKEDWFQTSTLLRRGFYEPWGRGYVAPWKLIPTGETDVVEATITTGNAAPNNIFFVLQDGTGVPARHENGRWILTLPATGHNQHYEVFAVYRPGNQNLPVGKLRVVSYHPQNRTVTLVEVNARVQDRERIERELNEIYNQYGVTFTVRTDDSILGNTDWDLDGDGMMTLTGSHFFTTESPEMRALRRIFQEYGYYEHGAYYIFIMQEANAAGEPDWAVMGDMPRGQHFGFVFMDAVRTPVELSRLIAHELGHGIFTLRHTFDREYGVEQGSTNNLMDYGVGTELAAFQWNVMSNPAWITRFDDEEEGRVISFGTLEGIVEIIRRAYQRNEATLPLLTNIQTQTREISTSSFSFLVTLSEQEGIIRLASLTRTVEGEYVIFTLYDNENSEKEIIRFQVAINDEGAFLSYLGVLQYNEWKVTYIGELINPNTAGLRGRLYAVDRGGNRRSPASLELPKDVLDRIYNNQQIIQRIPPGGAIARARMDYEVVIGAEHGLEIVKVFMFLGRYTDFEWSLSYGVDKQGAGVFGLRTIGLGTQVTRALNERTDITILNCVHSHPARELGEDSIEREIHSMRWDKVDFLERVEHEPDYGKFILMGTNGNIWQITRGRDGGAVPNNWGAMTPEQLYRKLTRR